jgi:uncharacterized membrane protein HdeD (DUF308 family)
MSEMRNEIPTGLENVGRSWGLVLVLGIVYVVQTFAARNADAGQRVLMAIVGILGVVAGVVALKNPGLTLGVLVILLGAFWLVQGIVDFFGALANSEVPARGWRIFGGLVSAIAGAVLLFWPGISLAALIWVTGIWLIVWGLVTVFASFQVRKLEYV